MSQYPVTVWDYRDYGGPSADLDYGSYANINLTGLANDSISSIKVAPFTAATLYENSNYGGDKVTIYGPKQIPRLGEYGGGWEDTVTSMRVVRMEPTMAAKMDCCSGISPAHSCGEFVPGSAKCASTTAEYCDAAHLGEAGCQSWCRQNPAQCDPVAIQFCSANPGHPFCACINSPANVKGIVNPKCVDRNCLNTGYLTTTMQNTNCPAFVDCSVRTELTNSGVVLSNTTPIQQNCGNVGVTPYVPGPVVEPQPAASPSIAAPQYMLIFVVFLMVILAAVLLAAWYYSAEENS